MKIIRAADLTLGDREVERLAQRFGLRTLEPLGGYENLLFRSTDPTGVVVRLTHSSRRSVDQINGELEFLEHCTSHGVSVVRPIRSTDDKLCVEWVTEAEETVLVIAMSEAPGARKSPEQWTTDDMETYGRTLGQLHAAAQSFVPSASSHRRPDWFDPLMDPGFAQDALRARYALLIDRARATPAGGTALLIHQDAHHGNLHIADDGTMTLFDFDDCAYGTATHDLAICLFYRFFGNESLEVEELKRFTGPFLRGYASTHPLPEDWPRGVDEFLSLREVTLLFLMQAHTKLRPIDQRFLERAERNARKDSLYLGAPATEWT